MCEIVSHLETQKIISMGIIKKIAGRSLASSFLGVCGYSAFNTVANKVGLRGNQRQIAKIFGAISGVATGVYLSSDKDGGCCQTTAVAQELAEEANEKPFEEVK